MLFDSIFQINFSSHVQVNHSLFMYRNDVKNMWDKVSKLKL